MSDTSQNKGLTEEISRREEDGAVFIVEDNVNITADEKEEKPLETDETEDLNDDPEINGALPDAIDLVLNEIGEKSPENDGKVRTPTLTFEDGVCDEKDNKSKESPNCSDPVFRYNVIDTIFLFWNTTTMGWVYGQMGPALPDLQIIGDVPLQQATWLFTGFAIGYLGGCLLAGLIQERFNPRLMLFLWTLGTAITIGTLPWIPVFIVMVIIRVVNGICIGGQDTGIHSMLFAIWAKEGGPFIQMTHCLSALGGILAPLVTQPFVSKETAADPPGVTQTTSAFNVTALSTNQTTPVYTLTKSDLSSATSPPVTVETDIQYAFLITAILLVTAAVPFLVAFLSKRRVKKASRQYSNESFDKNKLPKRVKQFILCIIFINSFVATAYIDLFPSFLVTFIMEQNQWTQQSASTLTSVFFGTYGIGNFIGVFILAYISSTKLIAFSYISSGIMILGILLSVLFTQTKLIWVTVALSGITMSSILPTLFTWTQENVTPITGRLASGLLISGSVGVMVNPLLLGYMMEVFTPMWFLYLSLGETILCGLLFTSSLILSRAYSSKGMPESGELKKEESPVREATPEVSIEQIKIYPRGTLYGV